MVPTLQESLDLAVRLRAGMTGPLRTRITVHPPYTALAGVRSILQGSGIEWGAQDLFWEEAGAYTGEISAAMLAEVGCRYVIIGHSERRRILHESNEMTSKKVAASLRQGLTPILCVGETQEERKGGLTLRKVESQVREGLAALGTYSDTSRSPRSGAEGAALGTARTVSLVIAYEPVWAIGTGVTPRPEEAQEVHAMLRQTLRSLVGAEADRIPIQYGGSVTPENAESLLRQPDIDGALVGGASLKADGFRKIIETAERVS